MEENLGRGEVRDGLMEESSDISESLSQLSPKPLSLQKHYAFVGGSNIRVLVEPAVVFPW